MRNDPQYDYQYDEEADIAAMEKAEQQFVGDHPGESSLFFRIGWAGDRVWGAGAFAAECGAQASAEYQAKLKADKKDGGV